MWKYHKIHHKDIITNASSTFKGHIIEHGMQCIGGIIPFILFYPKINYLGFIIGNTIAFISGIIRHEPKYYNLPILNYIYSDHHAIHHKKFNCNYSTYWIDYLHNTHYKKKLKD